MKNVLLLLIVFCAPSFTYAQKDSVRNAKDSLLSEISNTVESIKFDIENYGRYKIYKTENIYVLLKLDTATGIIKLIQWSLDKDKEFETYINIEDLSSGLLSKKGRFELYPTKNMYQFILLDTILGSTWHVQWGTKQNELWIRRISYF